MALVTATVPHTQKKETNGEINTADSSMRVIMLKTVANLPHGKYVFVEKLVKFGHIISH